MKKKEWEDRQ